MNIRITASAKITKRLIPLHSCIGFKVVQCGPKTSSGDIPGIKIVLGINMKGGSCLLVQHFLCLVLGISLCYQHTKFQLNVAKNCQVMVNITFQLLRPSQIVDWDSACSQLPPNKISAQQIKKIGRYDQFLILAMLAILDF